MSSMACLPRATLIRSTPSQPEATNPDFGTPKNAGMGSSSGHVLHLVWQDVSPRHKPGGMNGNQVYSHASRQRAELEADYSSVRPCVRACVPLLGEAQNLCFCTILSEISENDLCILQYLATVALKTHLHSCCHSHSPQLLHTLQLLLQLPPHFHSH